MVRRGPETRTLQLSAVRSNQLSYETNWLGLHWQHQEALRHFVAINEPPPENSQNPPLIIAVMVASGAWARTARLAQSVERKALNLVVVGSSPTVGDLPIL